MRPVADQELWEANLASSHRPVVEAVHVQTGTSIPLASGSVTLDTAADGRGRAELEVPGLEFAPRGPSDILAPTQGNEIQIRRGLEIAGNNLLVSLGIFLIDEAVVDDSETEAKTNLTLIDRSGFVIDAPFEEDGAIGAGNNYFTTLLSVVQGGYPAVLSRLPDTTLTTPAVTYVTGDDRWDFVQAMCEAIGYELFFDGDGYLTARSIPSFGGEAALFLVEGEAGVTTGPPPTLLSAARRTSRRDAYNRWIWTGENPDNETQVRGVATDDDSASPVNYFGPFGHKPDIQHSSWITTNDQAFQAANGSKIRNLGISRAVDFGALVNPALEPGDAVRIKRARSGIDEDHIIDQLTIPLNPGDRMTGTTRITHNAPE